MPADVDRMTIPQIAAVLGLDEIDAVVGRRDGEWKVVPFDERPAPVPPPIPEGVTQRVVTAVGGDAD